MPQTKPVVLVRRLEGFRRLGIRPATFYDWADPKSPRHKPELPRLVKHGRRSTSAFFVEHELEEFILAAASRREELSHPPAPAQG